MEGEVKRYFEQAVKAFLPEDLFTTFMKLMDELEGYRRKETELQLERRMTDLERANQALHNGYPVVARNFWELRARFFKVCEELNHHNLLSEEFMEGLRKKAHEK